MKIIHLSDTHFGNIKPAFDIAELIEALSDLKDIFKDEDAYLVVSGDITFQGTSYGYEQAGDFFEKTWLAHGGSRRRFLACPGNHDLCNHSFNNFDKFLYKIRRDHKADFSNNSCQLISYDSAAFLLVNSVHHLNHKYGLVDCAALHKTLKDNSNQLFDLQHKAVVVHHHLLGVRESDTSTIRNASSFLALLDEFKFDLVLHGHQHSQASISIGNNQMKIFSGRSLNFPTTGLVNGVSIISHSQGNWTHSPRFISCDNSPINRASFNSVDKSR